MTWKMKNKLKYIQEGLEEGQQRKTGQKTEEKEDRCRASPL